MAGCGCSNHRNRRHIADTQLTNVTVGYGATNSECATAAFRSEADVYCAAGAVNNDRQLLGVQFLRACPLAVIDGGREGAQSSHSFFPEHLKAENQDTCPLARASMCVRKTLTLIAQ